MGQRKKEDELIRLYRVERGLFKRIAEKLDVDASYVSRVASGERKSKRIWKALQAELERCRRSSRSKQ